ncbi:MAG: hypothetical protein C0392_05350 [Syntrophus sp. (in: bacteria)]|nr:hypothetical protein [Syntrophus sp. (in: bacteria)]
MKIPYSAICIFLSFTLLLTACQKAPGKHAGQPEKITIAYSRTFISILYHIASVKGYFKEEGLDVIDQLHEFGKLAVKSVFEGKADIAITTETPIMFAISGGRNIYIIAMIATSNRGNAIIAMKDQGIAQPTDLKGKRIGVTKGTSSDFFLDSFLSTWGLSRKDIQLVAMNPDEMSDALATGKVDAVSVWLSNLNKLEQRFKDKAVVFFDETIYSDNACMLAEKVFVKKHPVTVRKILRALIRAETFVGQNPGESRRLTAEFLKIDKTVLDKVWDSFDFKVSLDQALIIGLEDQTRWAHKHRLTDSTEMPDYLDFIYIDGLQSVKPEAVRIIG